MGAIVGIFFLSAFIAYAELAVYNILPKYIKSIYFWALIIVQNILLITDWFLVFNFQTLICPETIDILRETNLNETKGFLSTYLTLLNVISITISIIAINAAIFFASMAISAIKNFEKYIHSISIGGLIYVVIFIINFTFYGNRIIQHYSSITRTIHSVIVSINLSNAYLQVSDICRNVVATKSSNNDPAIIVILGESYSYFHSSLYDYEKATNPLLQNELLQGDLTIFDNVIAPSDHTSAVMRSIFSVGDGLSNTPLFPACFKNAGYRTIMYNNQYFIGEGERFFLSDLDISSAMFSARNANGYAFDGNLVAAMNPVDSNSLCIIHLMGQHYSYEDRYPKEFKQFTADDYDKSKYTDRQREFIAHYDNATLYNDYVIDQIIRKHEDKNCILIYFSDHGEEVFECRDYMGHGNAAHSPNIDLQIKVPFMIWASDKYQQNYPDKMERIKRAINFPITTNDIGHFLLDLADIRTEWLDYSRSFISDQYDTTRHRIVLNSIDYDAIK
ncbi:MAG: phosphoethanolamine transferase [Rikenellaceae bacterium]|nr:phosphoethanolamine transferase [Rikenellaceae bacterium]